MPATVLVLFCARTLACLARVHLVCSMAAHTTHLLTPNPNLHLLSMLHTSSGALNCAGGQHRGMLQAPPSRASTYNATQIPKAFCSSGDDFRYAFAHAAPMAGQAEVAGNTVTFSMFKLSAAQSAHSQLACFVLSCRFQSTLKSAHP